MCVKQCWETKITRVRIIVRGWCFFQGARVWKKMDLGCILPYTLSGEIFGSSWHWVELYIYIFCKLLASSTQFHPLVSLVALWLTLNLSDKKKKPVRFTWKGLTHQIKSTHSCQWSWDVSVAPAAFTASIQQSSRIDGDRLLNWPALLTLQFTHKRKSV